MAEEKNKEHPPEGAGSQKQPSVPITGGGGSGPVGGVGSVSQADRIAQIKEIQKASPFSRISDAVKKLTMADFGLSKDAFKKRAQAFKGMVDKVKGIKTKRGEDNFNQHIAGITENVVGKERFKHQMDPSENTELIEIDDVEKKKGSYVDLDWAPDEKGKVE